MSKKEKVMCEVVCDENVKFLWEVATDISDEKLKMSLMRSRSRVVYYQRVLHCKPASGAVQISYQKEHQRYKRNKKRITLVQSLC